MGGGPGGVKTALIKLSPCRQFISKPLVQLEDQNSQSENCGRCEEALSQSWLPTYYFFFWKLLMFSFLKKLGSY